MPLVSRRAAEYLARMEPTFAEIRTEEELNSFLNAVGRFHDGVIHEIHLLNSSYVAADLAMSWDSRLDLRVLVQRQWKNPSAVELLVAGPVARCRSPSGPAPAILPVVRQLRSHHRPQRRALSSRSRVSGKRRTSRISVAAWSLGLLRPCSQRSSVRRLTRSFRANTPCDM